MVNKSKQIGTGEQQWLRALSMKSLDTGRVQKGRGDENEKNDITVICAGSGFNRLYGRSLG